MSPKIRRNAQKRGENHQQASTTRRKGFFRRAPAAHSAYGAAPGQDQAAMHIVKMGVLSRDSDTRSPHGFGAVAPLRINEQGLGPTIHDIG